jgi:hypothetical protein
LAGFDAKNAPEAGASRPRELLSRPFDPLLAGSVDPFPVPLIERFFFMPRRPKPWFRGQRNAYYVEIGGKQVKLVDGPENAENEARAMPVATRIVIGRFPVGLARRAHSGASETAMVVHDAGPLRAVGRRRRKLAWPMSTFKVEDLRPQFLIGRLNT